MHRWRNLLSKDVDGVKIHVSLPGSEAALTTPTSGPFRVISLAQEALVYRNQMSGIESATALRPGGNGCAE